MSNNERMPPRRELVAAECGFAERANTPRLVARPARGQSETVSRDRDVCSPRKSRRLIRRAILPLPSFPLTPLPRCPAHLPRRPLSNVRLSASMRRRLQAIDNHRSREREREREVGGKERNNGLESKRVSIRRSRKYPNTTEFPSERSESREQGRRRTLPPIHVCIPVRNRL